MKPDDLVQQDRHSMLKLAAAALALNAVPRTVRAATSDNQKMKISIINSGNVGSALNNVWVKANHEVMFSSRSLENDKALAAKLEPNARARTPREAATFGDVVIVSVPYHSLPKIGKQLADLIKDKVMIDTCNPFVGRDDEIATWTREKGANVASTKLLPDARLVRAFNAIGAGRIGTVHEQPERIGMPIASDDAQAIAVTSRLIRDIGFEPVLVNKLTMDRHLMPGTPLAGEKTPEEVKRIAATLK